MPSIVENDPLTMKLSCRSENIIECIPGGDFSSPKVIFGRAFITVTGAPDVGVFLLRFWRRRENRIRKKVYEHEVDVKADVSI